MTSPLMEGLIALHSVNKAAHLAGRRRRRCQLPQLAKGKRSEPPERGRRAQKRRSLLEHCHARGTCWSDHRTAQVSQLSQSDSSASCAYNRRAPVAEGPRNHSRCCVLSVHSRFVLDFALQMKELDATRHASASTGSCRLDLVGIVAPDQLYREACSSQMCSLFL